MISDDGGARAFVWIGGAEDNPRRFKIAGRGRHLYRFNGMEYVYAGHTHAYCDPGEIRDDVPGCGGYMALEASQRAISCDGCGRPLVTADQVALAGR